jgi:uncharacterized protein YcfL
MRTRGLLLALVVTVAAGCASKPAPVARAPASLLAVGSKAPDGPLTRAAGSQVALADVLREHARTVLVFYRGFW